MSEKILDIKDERLSFFTPEVDAVEYLDFVPPLLEKAAHLGQDAALRVLSIRNKKKVSCF